VRPDEALDLLCRASEAGGLKVHMLAAQVVDLAKCGPTITNARPHKTSGHCGIRSAGPALPSRS